MSQLTIAISRTTAHAGILRDQAAIVHEKYLLETQPMSAAQLADIRAARNKVRSALDLLNVALGEQLAVLALLVALPFASGCDVLDRLAPKPATAAPCYVSITVRLDSLADSVTATCRKLKPLTPGDGR